MRALLARLLALFHRRQLDHELSDEMSTHLELSTADLVASGLSLEDAAEVVGIARSTAYEHWAYARVRLRCLLQGE